MSKPHSPNRVLSARVAHERGFTVVIIAGDTDLVTVRMPQEYIVGSGQPAPKRPAAPAKNETRKQSDRTPGLPEATFHDPTLVTRPMRLQDDTTIVNPVESISIFAAAHLAEVVIRSYQQQTGAAKSHETVMSEAEPGFIARLCGMAGTWLELVEVHPPPDAPEDDMQAIHAGLHWITTLQRAYLDAELTRRMAAEIEGWSVDALHRLIFEPDRADEVKLIERPGSKPLPSDYLMVMSNLTYQALREAVSFNTFRQVEDSSFPTALLSKGTARGHAQLRPVAMDNEPLVPFADAQAFVQRMWEQQKELSDLDADALDALAATWLAQARTVNDPAIVDVNKLLKMRGLKPKHHGQNRRSGYEPEQRMAMLHAIWHIQNIWLNMAEVETYEHADPNKRRRKSTRQAIQSRAFVITDLMGQLDLDGKMEVEKFICRPGAVFAAFLMGAGRQTALLSAKALNYDPKNHIWEKRLTRYLSWQWRCQAHNGRYIHPYRVATLLEAVGEEVNKRYPFRTRERLEKALDRLCTDGVLAAWQYERWDESLAETYSWSQAWLQTTIQVEPPDVIQEQYRTIEQLAAPKQATTNSWKPLSFGERVKQQRNERGTTQLELAEHIGITRAYLSMIERGRVREASISDIVKKRLQHWLG